MSEFRRRLMMAQKKEVINWDYEWYAPEEVPAWLHISDNAAHEMLDDCFRIYPATGTNSYYKIMMYFDPEEFPTSNSYEVEIDMYNTISRLAMSVQGGVGFNQVTSGNSTTGLLYIKRRNDTKYTLDGVSYYIGEVSTSTGRNSGNQITDSLRYKVTLTFDNVNNIAKLAVNGVSIQRTSEGYAPRAMVNRYANSGYIDIYCIKIRIL